MAVTKEAPQGATPLTGQKAHEIQAFGQRMRAIEDERPDERVGLLFGQELHEPRLRHTGRLSQIIGDE